MYYLNIVEEYFIYKNTVKAFPTDKYKLDALRECMLDGTNITIINP